MILEALTTLLLVVFTFTSPMSEKILDLLYYILVGKPKSLPPIRNKILLMSATELAEAIRQKRFTSEEAVLTYIKRIQEVDSLINACVDQRFQAAIEDAKSVDKMIQTGHKTEEEIKAQMPLLGVPFTCKEILGVEGLSQTLALKRYRNRKAPMDADTVARYKAAGAIPLVVTNIPTISLWWQTSNNLHGMTSNPYNSHRMVGGSSGGEAALLASAGAVIGIGTDIGGSIRLPAAFCGIYGHKPSRGIISNHRTTPMVNMKLDSFRSTGPMCRYARDLPLLVEILSGKNAGMLQLDEKVDFRKVKIFYIESFPGMIAASTDVKAAVRKAVKYFEEEFHAISIEVKIKELRSSLDIWQYKFLEADGSPLLPDITEGSGKIKNLPWQLLKSLFNISEYDVPIVYFAAIGKRHKDKRYYQCLKMYQKINDKLTEYLKDDAILLVPTFPEAPPHSCMSIPNVQKAGYTSIFNILGLPATQIPAGFSKHLPIGIQIVAGHCKDRLTLAAAIELEKIFGGWRSP